MSGSGLWQLAKRGHSLFAALASLVGAGLLAALACSSPAPASVPTPPPAPPAPIEVQIPIPPVLPPAIIDEAASQAISGAVNALLPPPPTRLPSIADLVEDVEPAVASISVESINRGLFFDFTDQGAGSGIIARPDGYIVTNFHVIQDVVGIKVHLPNRETYDAEIVGWDVVSDLAVLKIEPDEALPVVDWGNSDDVRVGDWVVAVGNALALKGGPTVTLGIISALGRTVRTEREPLYDMIQTDAAINDGNSGGPLVNLDGEVVGISTAMLRQAQGIGFAISSETALPIIDSLIEHGRVVRPLMGLNAEDVTPAIANRLGLSVSEGIIITRITSSGPAFDAGLQVGDVVMSLDGIPTSDMGRFLTLLWTYEVGDSVQVEYTREDKLFETSVELAERTQ